MFEAISEDVEADRIVLETKLETKLGHPPSGGGIITVRGLREME